MTPYLIITIDTEEGFDWSKPFSRTEYTLDTLYNHDFHMGGFYRQYDVTPISLLSYPILNDEMCQRLIKRFSNEKRYIFGTHLHSWVTPPFDEELSDINSYASNLPADLEYQKLKTLTEKFQEVLDVQPVHYKAGRYGIGLQSYQSLEKLGYKFDFSPCAKRDFRSVNGPDFSHIDNQPFTHPEHPQIRVFPSTADYIGKYREINFLQNIIHKPIFNRFKGRGILAKLKLLNFVPLTPEGVDEDELKDLTRCMLKRGQKYFHLAYHASSFSLNGNPYAKNQQNIHLMAEKIKNYVHFFDEIGGDIHFKTV